VLKKFLIEGARKALDSETFKGEELLKESKIKFVLSLDLFASFLFLFLFRFGKIYFLFRFVFELRRDQVESLFVMFFIAHSE